MIRSSCCCLLFALLLSSQAHAAWDSFEIIQWQSRDGAALEALRKLGVTGVAAIADRDGTGTPLDRQTEAPRAAGLRWYVENMATDFYAPYHRFTPGKPVNWRFVAAQERYRIDPNDQAALIRDPSLLDSSWRIRIAARLSETVGTQKRNRPLYYSLGDETGIDDLAAFWDFDFSATSVAGFRMWLRTQYDSIGTLNAEWGTAYSTWDQVEPETTREAMRRTDDNFSAWNDFKAWMDTSFADALRFGTDAIHHADPAALSAIEGAQTPGWGGYDYTKLADTVDVMEIYDDGENLPILRSLNPRIIPLATSFAATPAEIHRIWREVLRGVRGLILWDEDSGIVLDDGSEGPRGRAYAPLFAALRGDIGRRMIAAEPAYDSVAILYSPVSFRMRWMLDHRPEGDAWMRRSAEVEGGDNGFRVALHDYMTALLRMGLHPRFITPEQLGRQPPPESVLILPQAIALSDRELRSIAAFRGRVIADTPPGQFDGHGRRRPTPATQAEIVQPADLAQALTLMPKFRVDAPENDIDTYLFRSRGHLLLALQRRAPAEALETVTIHPTGQTVTIDPVTPTFLEIQK